MCYLLVLPNPDTSVLVAAMLIGSPKIRGRAWRNESAVLSLVLVFVLVDAGVKIATAQNSAMAIAAGLMLCVICVFIRLLAIWSFYLFLRKCLFGVAKERVADGKIAPSRRP